MNAKIHKKSRIGKALIQQLVTYKKLKNMYIEEASKAEGSNIKYFQGLADAYEHAERQVRELCERNNILYEDK